MTKASLVAKVAEKSNLDKTQAERAVNGIIESIKEILAEQKKLSLVGFGSFSVVKRESRTGRNPRTGETIEIPGCNVVKFQPGKDLKSVANQIKE